MLDKLDGLNYNLDSLKRRSNALSEKEKALAEKIATGLGKLDEADRKYVLGYVEGAAAASSKAAEEKQDADAEEAQD